MREDPRQAHAREPRADREDADPPDGRPASAAQVGWQLAVDAARIGTWDWDLVTGELRFDERLLDLFALDQESFGGTIEAFNATVHPEDRHRVTEALRTAIDTCGEYEAEYRVLRSRGGIRWISARGLALAGPDGTATRMLGAAYDTTAVQEREARVARVLEAMPTAFFHLDCEWRFSYLNGEAERLLEAPRSELVGEVVWDRFPAAVGSEFEANYRAAVESGEPVRFDAFYPAPLEAWYEVRAWPTPQGLSVYFMDVTARYLAQQQLERTGRRAALLAEVTSELVGTLDADDAIARLAPLVVPELGDWCLATLVSADRRVGNWRHTLRDVGAWHADPAMRPVLERYAEIRLSAKTDLSFIDRTLDTPRPVVLADHLTEELCSRLAPGEAQDLTRRLAPASAAIVRLAGKDRTAGLLSVYRGPEAEPFSEEDLDTLTEVAARAGLALENARLYALQRDLAEGLQRSMLTDPPEPGNLEFEVRYEPAAQAAQVGGDWYDAFLQEHGATVLAIGDVVGHDTEAAAAMGQVRGLLRGIAVHGGAGPAEVLRGVDRAMALLDLETTATAVVARLEQTPQERSRGVTRLRWSSAGHPPPFLIQPDGSVEVPVAGGGNLLLGLDPTAARDEQVVTVARGTTVVMYTDGLVERRGELIDTGLERLRTTLAELAARNLPLTDLCDEVLGTMLPASPDDDVAIVAVRLHPQVEPAA